MLQGGTRVTAPPPSPLTFTDVEAGEAEALARIWGGPWLQL